MSNSKPDPSGGMGLTILAVLICILSAVIVAVYQAAIEPIMNALKVP